MSRVSSNFTDTNAVATHARGALATYETVRERLALLLDISASMDEWFDRGVSKLSAMRTSVHALLAETSRRDTVVALYTFSHSCDLVFPFGASFDDIRAYSYHSDSSTDMAKGITVVVLAPEKPTRVVLLSDGSPDSVPGAKAAAKLAASVNVVIDTVAIGAADDELMRHIAEVTGGVFSRAATPDELRARFALLAPPNRAALEDKR